MPKAENRDRETDYVFGHSVEWVLNDNFKRKADNLSAICEPIL
jgi:hypothetical protein